MIGNLLLPLTLHQQRNCPTPLNISQSYHDWKKVQSSVKMKRKIGKRIEERCVSLKCTKWCGEILCWRFKHACFARNFGFPYCPCNALCNVYLQIGSHFLDKIRKKKCQILFYRQKQKNITSLSSAESARSVVSVKIHALLLLTMKVEFQSVHT